MFSYRAPVSDILLSLQSAAHVIGPAASDIEELNDGTAQAILDEAAKFAGEVLAPLNRVGDIEGNRLDAGVVETAPGWRAAYRRWIAGGWNAVSAPVEYGGQGLPLAVNAACTEIWNAANAAFALCPLLTASAIEALAAHGSEELKRTYLTKLVSGEWTGTMQLTEPAAGSDVGALRTRADRMPDGSYRLKGSKIFITYGEHDLTDNIVHLVLARAKDAPPGTKGLSLFLVPKFLVGEGGSIGARNDIYATGLEHKLGMHGSPTCTMTLGDGDGAVGFLVGAENGGMACMFTMMNQARLGIGLQGVGIADRAFQQALSYAHDRKQGRAANGEVASIFSHPDVKRMLLQMRTQTAAARALCYATALALDAASRACNVKGRQQYTACSALLTPMAKAHSTEVANRVAYLAVQVYGGMGFIEETGIAQMSRDARICSIYEGTNGIHAIDLVSRKLLSDGGHAVRALMDRLIQLHKRDTPGANADVQRNLDRSARSLLRSTEHLLKARISAPEQVLAAATPYLEQFSIIVGAYLLLSEAQTACEAERPKSRAVVEFYATSILVHAESFEVEVIAGSRATLSADVALVG